MAAIGMMEGAFFVSKAAVLKWVNNVLNTSFTKVEDCANGAAYCRVIAALYPNTVSVKRINDNAKLEYEFLNNYKILQKAFDDCAIQKHIDVGKLMRGKFQDNLEFLQWLKSFYEKQTLNTSSVPRAFKENTEDWELRRERDFFLNKLQHIEMVTNAETDPAAATLVKRIQHVLFNPEFI
jgi:hypothetical protein